MPSNPSSFFSNTVVVVNGQSLIQLMQTVDANAPVFFKELFISSEDLNTDNIYMGYPPASVSAANFGFVFKPGAINELTHRAGDVINANDLGFFSPTAGQKLHVHGRPW